MELAARIGQSLLKKNRTLTEQNDYLEERVGQITEEVCSHTHQAVTHKIIHSDYLSYNLTKQAQHKVYLLAFFVAFSSSVDGVCSATSNRSISMTVKETSPAYEYHVIWLKTLS